MARDGRKDLKMLFHVPVSNHLCVLPGSLANVFSSPFSCTQVRNRGQGCINKGKADPGPAFPPTPRMWTPGLVGERTCLSQHPSFLAGPGPELYPQGGERVGNVRQGQRNACALGLPSRDTTRWLCRWLRQDKWFGEQESEGPRARRIPLTLQLALRAK